MTVPEKTGDRGSGPHANSVYVYPRKDLSEIFLVQWLEDLIQCSRRPKPLEQVFLGMTFPSKPIEEAEK